MKILVAHNAYQQRGGEDAVVEAEIRLLRSAGHEVQVHTRHNDELQSTGRLRAGLETVWSARTVDEMSNVLGKHRPDILHVHNTFPLISPSIYWAAARHHLPVVQTLHNFRLQCPQAMFLRDGQVCEDCMSRLPLPAIRHGCYRGSRLQTAVLASMLVLHRGLGTWKTKVHRYIALNEFCRAKFVEGGLPAERVAVKPNFVDAGPATEGPHAGLLYVGRLSEEKGIRTLAQAAGRAPMLPLRVAGVGPLRSRLEDLGPALTLLGQLSASEVRTEMSRAAALVMPSLWYENFPVTLVEAFAAGLPAIVSRIGALETLVQDGVTGLHVTPGDVDDLRQKMTWVVTHPEEAARMGREARRVYERLYTPQANLLQLERIYAEAIAELRACRQDP